VDAGPLVEFARESARLNRLAAAASAVATLFIGISAVLGAFAVK
jgi:hypothetical protein